MISNPRLLGDRDVHIWYRSLESADADAARLLHFLSPDERQRAERFHYDQHRNEFIVSRGTLRVVLSSYAGTAPEALSFAYSEHGKPSLAEKYAEQGLNFNLSHTHGMMVMGVVKERRIGVDVEKIRSDFNVQQIAERFFSAREQSALQKASEGEQYALFFRCWTRKEAYIKAKGEGLSIPLRDFDVSLDEDLAELVGTRPDEAEAQRWKMVNLRIGPVYAAAAAIESGEGFEPQITVGDARDLMSTEERI